MKVLAAGVAGLLALIVLAVAIASSGGAGVTGLSPALAGAPPGLVAVAFQVGPATAIDPNVLLAIAEVETNWGQVRNAQPDDLVPDDIRTKVDAAALQVGSYLHRLQMSAAGGVPYDLRGALAVCGGSLAYADQVLSLAEPPPTLAGLPVVFPIPAPGWVQRIPTPQWPVDLAAHMSPSAVTNPVRGGRPRDLGDDAPG